MEHKRLKFVAECIERPERFEERIERQKLYTFATELRKKKVQTSDGKVLAAYFVRDLFGSLLCLSLERQIDMNEVLPYPLTPVPFSLSHVNGSMQKTPKSKLMKYLESLATTDPPKTVDVSIIDVMFFLRLHPNLPSTFDGVARYLLARVSEFEGHILHFVCDKWVQPSIKDCERKDRDKSK